MFGGPFCGDYCVGQPCDDCNCVGSTAGLHGGFYDCGCCLGRSSGRRCAGPSYCGPTGTACYGSAVATCCTPSTPACCATTPSCCAPAAPSCCAPVICDACASH